MTDPNPAPLPETVEMPTADSPVPPSDAAALPVPLEDQAESTQAGSPNPPDSGTAESLSAPASDPALPKPSPVLAARIRAIEGVLSFVDRSSARLSAAASGIRFGNVQKQEQQIRSSLRRIRDVASGPDAAAAEGALITQLDALQRDSSRLASSVTMAGAKPGARPGATPASTAGAAPVAVTAPIVAAPTALVPAAEAAAEAAPTTEASTTDAPTTDAPIAIETATAPSMTVQQAAGIRQGITRSLIALASAPLHIRLEFDPALRDVRPDTLVLAARVHAIHRFALGSLREIRWVDMNNARLAFGDAQEPTFVDARFDPQGRLQLPDAWRQAPSGGASGRSKPRPATSADARAGRVGAEKPWGQRPPRQRPAGERPPREGPPREGPPREGPPKDGAPKDGAPREGAPRDGPQRQRGNPGSKPPAGGQPRRTPPPGGRVGMGPPSNAKPPRDRRDGNSMQDPGSRRPGQSGERHRGDNHASTDPRAARPRNAINTAMADKLRAALATSSASTDAPAKQLPDADRAKDTGRSD